MPSNLQDYSETMDISQGIQEDCASNSSSSIPDHPHRRISGRVGRALPPSISERSVVLAIPEVPHKLSGIVCGLSHSIPHQTSPGQPHPSYDRQLYSCGMPSEARFEVPNPQSGSLADLTTLSGKCVAHLCSSHSRSEKCFSGFTFVVLADIEGVDVGPIEKFVTSPVKSLE